MFNVKFCSVLAIASALVAVPASAGIVNGVVTPLIEAGAPTDVDGPGTADSTNARIDPNLPTSPYSGVVSLNIRYGGQSFICSGALIDATHVLSAGHCIDTDGHGHAVDVSQPFATSGNDVRVIFNASTVAGSPGRAIVTASAVAMHPDYDGFNYCPDGSTGCVNDDISIITLSQPAPVDAQIYAISRDEVADGQSVTMVGYGTTGTGTTGYIAGTADFRTKRSGTNTFDLFDLDDEQDFAAGLKEVWYADFDGTNAQGQEVDKFCTSFGVCSGDLGNQSETNLGGGDSGGPSFVKDANGKLYLVANNTFGGTFTGQVQGAFGTYSGGITLNAYRDWIYANSDAEDVPEPALIGLFGLGALGLAARRRKAA